MHINDDNELCVIVDSIEYRHDITWKRFFKRYPDGRGWESCAAPIKIPKVYRLLFLDDICI